MISKWEDSMLGDVLTLQRGMDLPVQDRKGGKHPIVASTGVVGFHDEAPVKAPGVVIGRSGSIGGGQFIEQDFWPLNTTLWVKDFKGNDPRFCYYLLKSIDFSSMNAGSGVPTLNRNHLHPMRVSKPSVSMQKSISGALGNLDDRIALLRETNQTLEAIAQALFKSWFVDFDPVRAKAEGKLPEGIDAATAELFPDAFEETELGMVPKGWEVAFLGEKVKIAYGKNLPTAKLLKFGFPVYGGNGQIGFNDKYLYETRQVLVACRGAASGKFNQTVTKSFVTNNSLVLESSPQSEIPFGYLKGCILLADLMPFVTGSAQPQVTIDNLKNFRFLVPSVEILKLYENYSSAIDDRIEVNSQSISVLSNMRDTILPRLISGQLRITDTETELEKAIA